MPPPSRDTKVRFLTLLDPWTGMYSVYTLGVDGLKRLNTFGPLDRNDHLKLLYAYKQEFDAA